MKKRSARYGKVSVKESGKYVRIRWRENGKPVERSKTTWDAAVALAREVDSRLSSGHPGSPDGTLAAVADVAISRGRFPRYSDEAFYNLRSVVRLHIVPDLGIRKARSITRTELQDFLDGMLLAKGYSTSYVSKARQVLVKIGEYGVSEGIWTPAKNPASGIALPKLDDEADDTQLHLIPESAIPSDEEVSALIESAWSLDSRYGFLLEMAARSGLRWSEIMGLQAADFDFAARTVYVRRVRKEKHPTGSTKFVVKPPKTKAGRRQTVISADGAERIERFVSSQTGEFLLATRTGTPIRRSNFTKPLRRLRAVSGYPERFSVHSLRHYFGSRAIRLGALYPDVSKAMGHANPAITMTLYVRGDDNSVSRLAEVL